jgi:hypothetical protein
MTKPLSRAALELLAWIDHDNRQDVLATPAAQELHRAGCTAGTFQSQFPDGSGESLYVIERVTEIGKTILGDAKTVALLVGECSPIIGAGPSSC